MQLKDYYNFGAANGRCHALLCEPRQGQSWWDAAKASEAHSRTCDCHSDHDCFWCEVEREINKFTFHGQLCPEKALQRYFDGVAAGIRKGLKERGIDRSEWHTVAELEKQLVLAHN